MDAASHWTRALERAWHPAFAWVERTLGGTVARYERRARWRPAFAALAVALVIAALSWTLIGPMSKPPSSTALDPALARELSSEEFWRVPSDELLAHAHPTAGIVLPSPQTLELSLEESLL